MKPLEGFDKRSNTVQFTFLKRPLWLLLLLGCREQSTKARKSGTEKRGRLHNISRRPSVRFLRPVVMGLGVILGDALEPRSL